MRPPFFCPAPPKRTDQPLHAAHEDARAVAAASMCGRRGRRGGGHGARERFWPWVWPTALPLCAPLVCKCSGGRGRGRVLSLSLCRPTSSLSFPFIFHVSPFSPVQPWRPRSRSRPLVARSVPCNFDMAGRGWAEGWGRLAPPPAPPPPVPIVPLSPNPLLPPSHPSTAENGGRRRLCQARHRPC